MSGFVLKRDTVVDGFTSGLLMFDGRFVGYTLEDSVREMVDPSGQWYWRPEFKKRGHTAIPSGRYQLGVHRSPRFGKTLPHVLDVPDFAFILIHAGNDVDDTEGCILVGRWRDQSSGRVWDCAPIVQKVLSIIQTSRTALQLEVKNP